MAINEKLAVIGIVAVKTTFSILAIHSAGFRLRPARPGPRAANFERR